MFNRARPIAISFSAALLLSASFASAKDEIRDFAQAAPQSQAATKIYKTQAAGQSSFDKFTPRPDASKAKDRLDFSVFDTVLNTSVLYTGSSTRQRAAYKLAPTGTRIRTNIGHTSAYSLEGNKVVFSAFNKDYTASLAEYQDELEQMGNKVDISALPRNEQLAYWLNLHNVTVMDIIAQEYPVRRPSKIRIGPNKIPMHEAKLIKIQGQPMSLRDIREKIVFPNWKDPNVIYGFWYGDIGSPSLQTAAFTGKNLSETLDFSANEFTNSLRAINNRKNTVYVSKLYYDAAPYYFPNFEADLTAHLRPHLRDDVKVLLDGYSLIQPDDYETTLADTTGGVGNRLLFGSSTATRQVFTFTGAIVTNPTIRDDFVERLSEKRIQLARQGRLGTSSVTLTDIETEDRTGLEIE